MIFVFLFKKYNLNYYIYHDLINPFGNDYRVSLRINNKAYLLTWNFIFKEFSFVDVVDIYINDKPII